MATFSNFATLSYSGGTTNSNTVTGELTETVTATKTAVVGSYSAGDDLTYVISLVNTGGASLTGLTLTDDLGGYSFDTDTLYPLEYVEGSILYYVNGALQASPTVSAGAPLVISGISIPAGGNATLIYEAAVTEYAPLAAASTITNIATLEGTSLTASITATEEVSALERAQLTISKSLAPTVVTDNGQITYTFVIENIGNTAATTTDSVVLSDSFDPVLENLTVTYNGATWTEGTNYSYDSTTGLFTSVAGEITVPAAAYTQGTDGVWSISPGTATVVISGTV